MFVGHEFAAFAIAVVLARWIGLREELALSVGFVAALSAILPDLDLLVGGATYLGHLGSGPATSWEGLWGTSNAIHRGFSHTLLGGAGLALVVTGSARAAVGGGNWQSRAFEAGLAIAFALALAAVAGSAGGTTALLSLGVVLVGTVGLGTLVLPRFELESGWILLGAAVGLLTHPFGDVFLAAPPEIFYPIDQAFLTESVRLAADPTVNLVGIALGELAAVWAGLLAYANVTGTESWTAIDHWAAIGIAYPAVMLFVPTPTMVEAHWLGITLMPFAVVGLIAFLDRRNDRESQAFRALATGVTTMTIAALSYLFVVLAVGPP